MSILAVTGSVFRKDLWALWPLAILTPVLILARPLFGGGFTAAAAYLPIASALAAGLFVLALVQQDAPASLRHDWLTRPIGRLNLLSGKALLAALVVLAPAAIGPALAAARDGAPVSEALLAALGGVRVYVALGFGLLVVAAVTSTLLEAIGLLIGLFLLFVFVPPVALSISGMQEGVLFLGSGWVILTLLGTVALAGGAAVLWLQYARRRTVAARAALGVTLAGFAVVLAAMDWDAVFAVQRAVSPAEPAERGFALSPAPGCLEARWLGAPPAGDVTEGPWSAERQREAGFGALAFWTGVQPRGLPPGWRIAVTHVGGQVLDARGATLARLSPGRFLTTWGRSAEGGAEARHAWLMPRQQVRALSPTAHQLRLDYKVALLAPDHTAELATDGRRRNLPGLGACAATARAGGLVEVSCFKAGRRADLLTARPVGAGSELEVAGGWASFAPDALQLTAGQRETMVLAGAAGAGAVVMTAYEARAHAARSVRLPGLLGGPACRAPDPT